MIANTIRALREREGISQEKLGFEIGVSRQTIFKWENASAFPDIWNAVALADLFGITLDELVGRKHTA